MTEQNSLLADVQQEIATLEARLSELRTVERWLASKSAKAAAAVVENGVPVRSEPHAAAVKESPYRRLTVRQAALDVLRKAGKPLKTRSITEALLAGGYQTTNVDTMNTTVFSTLDREADLFKKVGPGLWALVDGGDGEEIEEDRKT
jgi:hypothetical protein